MKKIVITQLIDNSISIYGVFKSFKEAYEQLNRFNENIMVNSGYAHYKDKVRGFTKAVRDNHVFVKSTLHYIDEEAAMNEDKSKPKNYPQRGALDITKAKQELGYNPQFDLSRGLDDTLNKS